MEAAKSEPKRSIQNTIILLNVWAKAPPDEKDYKKWWRLGG